MPTKKPIKKIKTLKTIPKLNKKILIILTVTLAAVGAYFLFFASAATNNCQAENNVQICDINMVGGGSDTILSKDGEAETLGAQGWGWYYGADFRAPTTAYNGAVPVYRVYNAQYTWHDWVTDNQKRDKEAKYSGVTTEGVAFFAWTDNRQPGTVPVYRLTRGGSGSQSIFSTDKAWVDKILAEGTNNPDGWKIDTTMPGIAFYAFPPNYKVANQVNPYDCSIQVNFVSDRCTAARNALTASVNAGNIPKDSSCPTTYDAYRKAPFPGQFSADCQKWWNTYSQDCSKQENFLSDRCKGPREALAAEMARQAQLRAAAAQAAAKARSSSNSGSSKGSGSSVSRSGSRSLPGSPTPSADPNVQRYFEQLSGARARCASQGKAVDPRTFACVLVGPPAPSETAYICVINGKHINIDGSWSYLVMRTTIYAYGQTVASQQCTKWKSSINAQNDYKSYYVVEVYKKP